MEKHATASAYPLALMQTAFPLAASSSLPLATLRKEDCGVSGREINKKRVGLGPCHDMGYIQEEGDGTLENALKSKGISKDFDEWIAIAKAKARTGRSGDS